jgi:mRNA interferase MazF
MLAAPLTTTLRTYPTRVNLTFKNKRGQIALDQLRVLDRQRLIRRMGVISAKSAQEVSGVLVEMFVR